MASVVVVKRSRSLPPSRQWTTRGRRRRLWRQSCLLSRLWSPSPPSLLLLRLILGPFGGNRLRKRASVCVWILLQTRTKVCESAASGRRYIHTFIDKTKDMTIYWCRQTKMNILGRLRMKLDFCTHALIPWTPFFSETKGLLDLLDLFVHVDGLLGRLEYAIAHPPTATRLYTQEDAPLVNRRI